MNGTEASLGLINLTDSMSIVSSSDSCLKYTLVFHTAWYHVMPISMGALHFLQSAPHVTFKKRIIIKKQLFAVPI